MFYLELDPGPVSGTVYQEGQQLDRWEDVDLSKPWHWVPPQNTTPPNDEPYVWPAGWTEIGATED